MVDEANGPVLSRAQSAGGAIIPVPRLAWPGMQSMTYSADLDVGYQCDPCR